MPKITTIQNKQCYNDGKKGGALNHTGCDNHRGTQVAGAFRLAGDCLHSGFADFTDADSGGDGSDGGAKGGTRLSEGCARGCLENDCT